MTEILLFKGNHLLMQDFPPFFNLKLVKCHNQGCRLLGAGERQPPPPSLPPPFFGTKVFFLRKIRVDKSEKKDGVDKKNDKKWQKKEGVQSEKLCPSHKFFYVLFAVTQTFIVRFS